MAKKKAEMEAHRREYYSLMDRARKALAEGSLREAVALAVASWEHVDGMMQYERRYEDKSFDSIEALDLVLKHAPLLFDSRSLEKLETLLKEKRRIARNTSQDLSQNLADARILMWEAHRLWDHLELESDVRQDELRKTLQGEQGRWQKISEAWADMGLILRIPEGPSYRLAFSTRLKELQLAKCASCGVVGNAPKAIFLDEQVCPKCKTRGFFVLLARKPGGAQKE